MTERQEGEPKGSTTKTKLNSKQKAEAVAFCLIFHKNSILNSPHTDILEIV